MSELREALALAAALPQLQQQLLDELIPLLRRIPLAHLSDAIQAIKEHHGLNYESLMRVKEAKVRVAVWEMRDNRCEHKQYQVGNVQRAKIGEIGEPEWIEAWIA